ncbi:MAG TPA: AraC family transcriptional regulator ligand-binding domain-containing protein [Bosea sp. (in: a-proteobacteria)]|uniref:AraC family transcriptional regulator n=1 Tax=Bosea sp. (in: a-proteobacteria) TaxID=1871050 RepID=UPI002E122EC2|nr:AraC family transcriptional regulator ligand-binding domain-containing protein [Bosea sp. (in: a-proteobacteria)]
MNGTAQPMMQRAGVLAELPGLLRELGSDPAAIFDGSGLDPDNLTTETRLPFRNLVSILDRAAQATACPHLGLLLGQRFTLQHHGVIGALMSQAPTLHHALLDFVTWQPGYSSGAIVYLNRIDEDLAFGYGALDQISSGTTQLYDAVIAVGIGMVQQLTGGRVAPVEAHFSRSQPANAASHGRLLKLPVRFNQAQTCLILDGTSIGTKLTSADPGLHRQTLDSIERAMQARLVETAQRVRHALRPMLCAGDISMETAASKLGLHPRTLRRRLSEEGRTFEELRDEMRFTVARELLEMTDLRIGDISQAVALASPGVFAETFCRWSGMTPTRWRQRAASRMVGSAT